MLKTLDTCVAINSTIFALLCFINSPNATYDCSKFPFFFAGGRRHTRSKRDWSSDVCSSDLIAASRGLRGAPGAERRRGGGRLPGNVARGGAGRRRAGAHRPVLDGQQRDPRRGGHRGRRSEERRAGKGERSWWSPDQRHEKKI